VSYRVENYFDRNKERLKEGAFDIKKLQAMVYTWISLRKAMIQLDRNIPILAEKNLPDEIGETRDEFELIGTQLFDLLALLTETMDTSFFPLASTVSNNIFLDEYDILPHINDAGKRDDIFDVMTEVGGNVTRKNLSRDLHEFFRYFASYVAGLPVMFSLETMMAKVLDKNAKNYPDQFFNGIHPFFGRELNPDELIMQYKHSRLCLKMIRLVHREILHHDDRDYGLQKNDWEPYSQYIFDFEHSEINLTRLAMELSKDHQLTPAQSERVFKLIPLQRKVSEGQRQTTQEKKSSNIITIREPLLAHAA